MSTASTISRISAPARGTFRPPGYGNPEQVQRGGARLGQYIRRQLQHGHGEVRRMLLTQTQLVCSLRHAQRRKTERTQQQASVGLGTELHRGEVGIPETSRRWMQLLERPGCALEHLLGRKV